jgi:error-prone DNA polymerase
LRYVSGLRQQAGERIENERKANGPYADVEDLKQRTGLRDEELARLAEVGALASLGLTRRAALWQAALAARPKGELFAGERPRAAKSPLPEMTAYEQTRADFAGSGITVGRHPVAYVRESLDREGIVRTADVPKLAPGSRIRFAGVVIVRQRPGTANGTIFLTLEDETGMAQAIVRRELFQENRATIVGNPGLVVEGILQNRDGSISIQAERFWPLRRVVDTGSHDFH